jgi:hypothetical protein
MLHYYPVECIHSTLYKDENHIARRVNLFFLREVMRCGLESAHLVEDRSHIVILLFCEGKLSAKWYKSVTFLKDVV